MSIPKDFSATVHIGLRTDSLARFERFWATVRLLAAEADIEVTYARLATSKGRVLEIPKGLPPGTKGDTDGA